MENKLSEIKYTVLPWLKYSPLNRKNEVVHNQLRIGHIRFSHGHIMEKTERSLSPKCNTINYTKYMIIHCRKFTEVKGIQHSGQPIRSKLDQY